MEYGDITLKQLSGIIARNNAKAADLGLQLSWTIIDDVVIVRVGNNERTVEDIKIPFNKDWHFITAEMQHFFWTELLRAEDLFSAKSPPTDTQKKKWVKGRVLNKNTAIEGGINYDFFLRLVVAFELDDFLFVL